MNFIRINNNLNRFSVFHSEQGRFVDLISIYEPALANLLETRGQGHPDTLNAAYTLADAYRQAGNHADAETMYKGTIQLQKENLPERDPALIVPLTGLGLTYLETQNLDLADDALLEALTISQETFGFDDIATAEVLMNFALLRQHQGNYEDAESALLMVRTITEEAYGTEAPQLVQVIEQIGTLYSAMGRDDEAADSFAEAANIAKGQ